MKPILFNTEMVRAIQNGAKTVTRRVVKERELIDRPPYRPGDILYVRETWAKPYGGMYRYRADYNEHDIVPADMGDVRVSANLIKWRPSIHMPRKAARIFLRLTDIRVERLQAITENQAKAEGAREVPWAFEVDDVDGKIKNGPMQTAIQNFAGIWDSTIKPADRALYSWDANPYVWVIEFERISREEAKKWIKNQKTHTENIL